PDMQDLRPCRLLRLVEEQARDEALPRDRPPGHPVVPAGRELDVVLRGRGRVATDGVVAIARHGERRPNIRAASCSAPTMLAGLYGATRPFFTNCLCVSGYSSAKAASICSATSSISRCG